MKDDIIIRQPGDKEFEEVKKYIEDFWLDNETMLKEQFRIILFKNKLVGFGRIRKNKDATELCSLGIIKEMRLKGLGKAMVKGLLSEVKKDVFVVCVIPDFFRKAGFIEVTEYPISIQKKVNLCTTHYHVGEPYKVLVYKS